LYQKIPYRKSTSRKDFVIK